MFVYPEREVQEGLYTLVGERKQVLGVPGAEDGQTPWVALFALCMRVKRSTLPCFYHCPPPAIISSAHLDALSSVSLPVLEKTAAKVPLPPSLPSPSSACYLRG